MSGRQTISVDEVRRLAIGIFDKMTASGIISIEIDQPTYWSLFPAEIFQIDAPDVVTSDIKDDLPDLRIEVADAESAASLGTPWHALHHLAGVCSVMAAATLEPTLPSDRAAGAIK